MALKDYLLPAEHPEKVKLNQLMDSIDNNSDICAYIAHVKSGKYYNTTASFESITSYSINELESEGVDFYIRRVSPATILHVMEIQANFFKQCLNPEFDQSYPHIVEMSVVLPLKHGGEKLMFALCINLAYLPNGEPDFALCIIWADRGTEKENHNMRLTISTLLSDIKKSYWAVYQPEATPKPHLPLEIVFATNPQHVLTQKEKEVLSLIAKGHSTKAIAVTLNISENTVETHRKKMFNKFKVANVAELIKKTSKLYWLE